MVIGVMGVTYEWMRGGSLPGGGGGVLALRLKWTLYALIGPHFTTQPLTLHYKAHFPHQKQQFECNDYTKTGLEDRISPIPNKK
jgi:hypothetical protein